jgi:hypothetical protein
VTFPCILQIVMRPSLWQNRLCKGEWETGITSDFYIFHLWAISDKKPYLAVLDKADVAPHIPSNQGEGNWDVVQIPFAAFESVFAIQLSL